MQYIESSDPVEGFCASRLVAYYIRAYPLVQIITRDDIVMKAVQSTRFPAFPRTAEGEVLMYDHSLYFYKAASSHNEGLRS